MEKRKYKGLIFSAGYGTRLKPITDYTPKPLIQFFDKPILFHCIDKFRKYGINDVSINTCHLAEKIESAVKNFHHEDIIKMISRENPILGTGGALLPLKDWLGDADLIIYSGDIVSEIEIDKAIKSHEESRAIATMVLLSQYIEGTNPVFAIAKNSDEFNKKQYVIKGIGKEVGLMTDANERMTKHTFGNFHVLSNEFIRKSIDKISWSSLKNGNPVSIIDFYKWSIERKEAISAYLFNQFWEDLGTPENLFSSHKKWLDLVRKRFNLNKESKEIFTFLKNRLFIEEDIKFKNGAKIISPSFVYSNHVISENSEIGPYAFIYNDVKIPKGLKIKDTILFSGTEIPDTSELKYIEKKIIGKEYKISI